jgi:ABC-type molybdenum transport system ATPase subunit/photorepair protein PhrA
MKKLETIWDFNPTEEELDKLEITGIYESKEEYIKNIDEEVAISDIYWLSSMRGDKKTSEKYFALLSQGEQKYIIELENADPVVFKDKNGNILIS